MRKHIWIMNHYAGNMYFDRGGRHYNFAKYLKQAGYEPVVFCANSKHGPVKTWFPNEALWHEHTAEEIGVPFVFVKARTYTGNGKQRVLNMLDFYCNVKKVAKEYAAKYRKPDVIYASSVHPLTLVAGIQLAKRFGIKCVCEVRDLWPESLVALGMAGPHNPAVLSLRWLEKWIYKKADTVVFTCEGGYDYIVEQCWEKAVPHEKVFYINNGVDLKVFDANRERFQVDDPDLEDSDIFKVVYTGSIRPTNGVDELVDCAVRLRDVANVKFLVYGGGPDLGRLQERVLRENLTNLVFKGQLEKKYIPYILSKSSLNVLNYAPKATVIYRFGSSQNKLFEYLASGKPVLCNVKIGYSIVDSAGCGLSLEKPGTGAYADAVRKLSHLPTGEYQEMCRNARRAAEEFDFRNLTAKLMEVIEKPGKHERRRTMVRNHARLF